MLYDKHLSVNRNEACAFCHMPEAGFTGPVSELNRTTGSYPGSVRTRFSERKPQSHAYAPLSPVLHYNPGQGDLVGGNFWDMRATGRRLGNPAAEQAQGPPTNPVEMGLPDIACAVYRASQRPYRSLFEKVWGPQAFAIKWPNDVEQVCDQPGPAPAADPLPVHLDPLVTLLGILFLAELLGIAGAVVAVPAVALAQIVARELLAARRDRLAAEATAAEDGRVPRETRPPREESPPVQPRPSALGKPR